MLASAAAIYTQMTLAMSAQAHPATMHFTQRLAGRGITLRIIGDRFGNTDVYLSVSGAQASPATFAVDEDDARGTERTTDETTHAIYPDQRIYWSVTWPVIRTLGLRPPTPTTPRPLASVSPDADSVAIGDRSYDMEYAGEAAIDGHLCYHLELKARGSKDAHPLTDLYVDTQTDLLREAVLGFRNEELIGGSSGTIALDFDRVGNYWLVTHGRIDARAHSLFRHAGGSATFENDGFRFTP